jgi:flavodoxin
MNKNIIFVFSGTGNSLKVAKDIAAALGDCDIISMGRETRYDLIGGHETIGFVFPTYYRGEPIKVREFITPAQFATQQKCLLLRCDNDREV